MMSSTNFVFISRQILLADHHRNRMRTGTHMLGATVSSLQHISRSNIVITSPNLETAPLLSQGLDDPPPPPPPPLSEGLDPPLNLNQLL